MSTFTKGPWRACSCKKCFTVSSKDHPIALIEHGKWGDPYPAIRLVGESSLDMKAEAYMELIDYGTIDENTALANCHLIAAAPDLHEALIAKNDLQEKATQALRNYLPGDGLCLEATIEILLGIFDGPEQREADSKSDAALAKARGES